MHEILAGFFALSWAEITFLLKHLTPAVGLAVSAWALGRAFTTRIPFASAWESTGMAFTLGLGLLAALALGLGLAGLLTGTLWIVTLTVATTVSLIAVFRHRAANEGGGRPALTRPLAIGAGLVAVVFFGQLARVAMYPPVAWDATMYHLAAAKVFSTSHTVEATPFLRFPVFPQLAEVLFAAMIGVHGQIGAHLVSYISILGVLLLVIGWARRLGGARVGWWAAMLWIANPIVLWLGSTGYVDATLTLFVTAGLYGFWVWRDTGDGRWLALSGVCTGFSCGTKYSALFVGLVLGLTAIFWAIRLKRPGIPLLFGLAAAAAAGPWYGRVLAETGSPVFPFLSGWFGSGPFSAEDVASLTEEMKIPGIPQTVGNFLRLPWLQCFDDGVFRKEAPLNPVYVVMMVLPLAGLAWRRVRWAVAFGFAFTVYWFLTFQQQRYLIPVLPLGAVTSAYVLDWLLRRGWQQGDQSDPGDDAAPASGVVAHAITAVGVLMTIGGLHLALDRAEQTYAPRSVNALYWGAARDLERGKWRATPRGPLPTTETEQRRFLARRRPAYHAYWFANQKHGADYRLLALYNEENAVHADGVYMGDWLGPARYSSIIPAPNGKTLWDRLEHLRADYFLAVSRKKRFDLPRDPFFGTHFVPVYARKDIYLFERRAKPAQIRLGDEVLVDPGFETGRALALTDAAPGKGWATPRPEAISRRGGAQGSRGAARIDASGGVTQIVAVRPWTVYSLSLTAQGTGDARADVVIQYYDERGTLIDRDEHPFHLVGQWRRVGWTTTAPADAARARVSIGAVSPIMVDDVRLRPLIVE